MDTLNYIWTNTCYKTPSEEQLNVSVTSSTSGLVNDAIPTDATVGTELTSALLFNFWCGDTLEGYTA